MVRARRLAAESGKDERWGGREVERTDGERRSFFKRLHGIDAETATHCDLVVNTDVLSVEEAARIIAGAAGEAWASPLRRAVRQTDGDEIGMVVGWCSAIDLQVQLVGGVFGRGAAHGVHQEGDLD